MKVEYKDWKSGEKYEEVQAKIYTEISGLPANPDEIGPRNDRRGVYATRYAFTKDGEPLAYITSDVVDENLGRVLIGYPWSLQNCPVEVKGKLLNDMIDTWKKKESTISIITNVDHRSKTSDEQIAFFEEHGFVRNERDFSFTKDFDIETTSKKKYNDSADTLKVKIATDEDIDTLVSLTKADPRMSQAFQSDDAFNHYFKDRVLKNGHAVILYDGDKAVAASAPLLFKPDGSILVGDEERVIMRFTSILPGYSFAWKRLVTEVAKEAKNAGWTKTPIRTIFGFSSQDDLSIAMAEVIPEINQVSTSFIFRVNKKEV